MIKTAVVIVVVAALIYGGWRFLVFVTGRALDDLIGGGMLSGPPAPRSKGDTE